MSEKKESYELLFFSTNGNLLFKGGTFLTEQEALNEVNVGIDSTPGAATWKVIKVTKTIAREGKGLFHRPRAPAPTNQGRWW